jgi:hypothetical protein
MKMQQTKEEIQNENWLNHMIITMEVNLFFFFDKNGRKTMNSAGSK